MTPDERNLITGLFDRLRKADGAAGNKDRDALQLIQQQTVAVPTAPYLLVQTVLVQEHALTNAQARIADLERQVANARQQQTSGQQGQPEEGGSFLGNLLKKATGAVSPQPPPLPASAQMGRGPGQSYGRQNSGQPGGGNYDPNQQQPGAPYPTTNTMAPGGGGSFLRSALGTAAGVAGGAMLFQGIQGLMGHNAGPFAGGMAGLGGGAGHGAGAGAAATGGANPDVSNAGFGESGTGGGTVGDFSDQFGGGGSGGGGGTVGDYADAGQGGGGGGTVGDYADAGQGGGGGFFDSGPNVQDAGFDDQGGAGGGGTVGDYMDSGGDTGGDDGGGFFDGGGDDSMV